MILAVTMNPSLDKVYLVDNFQAGKVYRPYNQTVTAGGKGLNVARVLSQLNQRVIAGGVLGGRTGDKIADKLKKFNIDNQFVTINGETRTCINVTDNSNSTSTELLEQGPDIYPEEKMDFLKKYEALMDRVDIITLSGSLPPGLPDDFYYKLVEIAVLQNKKVILDSSGKYLFKGLEGNPYMITPNREEIKRIYEIKDDRIEDFLPALQHLKDRGIEIPLTTLGSRGCLVATGNGFYHFRGPELKTVNTVGSGDAFVAGCTLGLDRGENTLEMIKLGMACGMANTQFLKTGQVTREKVEKYRQLIEVRKLE